MLSVNTTVQISYFDVYIVNESYAVELNACYATSPSPAALPAADVKILPPMVSEPAHVKTLSLPACSTSQNSLMCLPALATGRVITRWSLPAKLRS